MTKLSLKTRLILPALFISWALLAHSAFAQTNTETRPASVAPLESSLSYVAQLTPLAFNLKTAEAAANPVTHGQQYGFSAEEVEKVLPALIKRENKMVPAGKNAFRTVTVKTVDLEKLIPLLVGSIKDQQAEIEKLKSEVRSLRAMSAQP